MTLEIFMTLTVVFLLAGGTGLLAGRFPRALRTWIWIGFAEYMVCSAAQMIFLRVLPDHGDAYYYAKFGAVYARFLDDSFWWAAPELTAVVFHQPSAFDNAIYSAGTNTGSMFAIAAWMLFVLRGSEIAVQVLIAGLSFWGGLAIYSAWCDAQPRAAGTRLFFATVLFPSTAFWTSALHKESFCILGLGCILVAWRAAYHRRVFRTILAGIVGVAMVLTFRAPILPPVIAGLAAYFIAERIQRTDRGASRTLLGPLYVAGGMALLAAGMVLVSRTSPELGLDRIADTLSSQQHAWTRASGGSMMDVEAGEASSVGGQLARAPLALINALLRPQLFDVRNPLMFVSAVEMTAILWLLVRAAKLRGPSGIYKQVVGSPFLLMCAVVTIIGCTFVGLATLNYGSLARYRVPVLPFYGALIAILTEPRKAALPSALPAIARGARLPRAPRRRWS